MAVTISNSSFVKSQPQIDGRSWVEELHLLSNGVLHRRQYLTDVGFDISAALIAYAATILDTFASQEVNSNLASISSLGSLANPTLVYSTITVNILAVRDLYKQATQLQAIMIADYFNSLTNAQLQSAFGITAGQATTLRTNTLAPAAANATAIRNAVGQ